MDQQDSYDPDTPPVASHWLALDEAERIEIVASYHRHHRIRLPNTQLHAVIHVIVENQLAIDETVVIQTLARLQQEGLPRHDALHAIGTVLAEQMHGLLQGGVDQPSAFENQKYHEELGKLTAQSWLNSG